MVRQEWKKLFHNKILLLVVIAVIAIPSIYTTLFWGLCGIHMERQTSFLLQWSIRIRLLIMKGRR